MKLFKKDIPFMQYQVYLVVFSILLTIASLMFIAKEGLRFGIDFTGGIKLQYQFSKPVDSTQITTVLSAALKEKFVVQQFGREADKSYVLDIEKPESSIEGFSEKVTQALNAGLKDNSASLLKEEAVGPKAGQELRRKGELAVIITWILILVYIGFRFDFYFSPGAIIALIHDLIITLGIFAISGREISLTVLAAFLTLLGYSVNDTIIVYDRVRENARKFKSMPVPELVNLSINETLSRTIVTSLVVFFVVLVLFIMGQGDIQDFAFAMLVGVITGTYSSIFIASPVYIYLKKKFPQKGK